MTTHANLTLPNLLCCVCGVPIQHNPTNMCINCLHDQVDITEDINKKLCIHSCRTCGRFLGPPWQALALESKELMILCLRKISGLHRLKVIDAVWIWTEPHSMRLKIKLTVQKEIMNGALIQQSTIVEFMIRNQQCRECESNFAQGAWEAVVQVRQRVTHKRTFFYLEQLILKHHAHSDCVKIVTFRDGIDFYFKDKNQGLRFLEFLKGHIPLKSKYSRKLISADHSDNTAEFKHNYLVEIVPICKDDLVLLPKELAAKQSNISPLVLVKRVGAELYVIDPLTSERTEVNSEKYWRFSFSSLLSSRQLIKFVILSVEPTVVEHRPSARMRRKYHKYQTDDGNTSVQAESVRVITKLAECVVARERDFGVTDTQFTCVSHLGSLLQPGNTVLGYDLSNVNLNIDEEGMKSFDMVSRNLPDVILVRKCYDRERNWTLKNLKEEAIYEEDINEKDQEGYEADKEVFLQQLEGDREMRANIQLFKKGAAGKKGAKVPSKKSGTAMDTEDADEDYDEEEVRLDELLDDMTLTAELRDEDKEIPVLSGEELQQHLSTVGAETNDSSTTPKFDSSPFEGKPFSFL